MKPVGDKFLDQAEELAQESMKAMKEFLKYSGDNPQYYHRAKVAAAGLTNYVRLRATETNRMEVEHMTGRKLLGKGDA
jgi:mRNA-degrading endonuclease RelE of RelBE toxin-antitoxin system